MSHELTSEMAVTVVTNDVTATVQKRRRGAPGGNKNAAKHGLHGARRVLSEFGMRAIDGRSSLGVQLREFRSAIVADLGGNLSAQQEALLDIVVRNKLMLDGVDMWLLQQPSLINKRKKSLLPVVQQRLALAESMMRALQLLGLERVEAKPTLQDMIAKVHQKAAAAQQHSDTRQRPADTSATQLGGNQAQRETVRSEEVDSRTATPPADRGVPPNFPKNFPATLREMDPDDVEVIFE